MVEKVMNYQCIKKEDIKNWGKIYLDDKKQDYQGLSKELIETIQKIDIWGIFVKCKRLLKL